MALLGAESFDIYDTDDITDYWQIDGNSDSVVNGAGRCGSNALFVGGVLGPRGPFKGVGPGNLGGYCGMAVNFTGIIGQNMAPLIIGTANGHTSITTFIRADGSIAAAPLSGPTICSSAAGILTQGRWYHLGFEWYSDFAPNGYFKIWVNGILVASVSGIKTRAEVGNPFNPNDTGPWGGIEIGSMLNFSAYYDDVYWGDTTGPAPWNGFLGDLRVQGQMALTDVSGGGGTYNDFIPLSGVDHGAMVDDVDPDDDATYNASASAGAVDTYKFPNIAISAGTVYGIQLMANVIKTDPGPRSMADVVLQGGVLTVGTTQGISQTDYTYKAQMFQTNPTTSTAWNATTADNMEGGIKVIT